MFRYIYIHMKNHFSRHLQIIHIIKTSPISSNHRPKRIQRGSTVKPSRPDPMAEPWSPATSRFAATASDGASTHHEASGGGRGGWNHTKTMGKP